MQFHHWLWIRSTICSDYRSGQARQQGQVTTALVSMAEQWPCECPQIQLWCTLTKMTKRRPLLTPVTATATDALARLWHTRNREKFKWSLSSPAKQGVSKYHLINASVSWTPMQHYARDKEVAEGCLNSDCPSNASLTWPPRSHRARDKKVPKYWLFTLSCRATD